MTNNSNIFLNPGLWLILALTLGLAPFTPEPHIWEKLKWIVSGAHGMQAIDWLISCYMELHGFCCFTR